MSIPSPAPRIQELVTPPEHLSTADRLRAQIRNGDLDYKELIGSAEGKTRVLIDDLRRKYPQLKDLPSLGKDCELIVYPGIPLKEAVVVLSAFAKQASVLAEPDKPGLTMADLGLFKAVILAPAAGNSKGIVLALMSLTTDHCPQQDIHEGGAIPKELGIAWSSTRDLIAKVGTPISWLPEKISVAYMHHVKNGRPWMIQDAGASGEVWLADARKLIESIEAEALENGGTAFRILHDYEFNRGLPAGNGMRTLYKSIVIGFNNREDLAAEFIHDYFGLSVADMLKRNIPPS